MLPNGSYPHGTIKAGTPRYLGLEARIGHELWKATTGVVVPRSQKGRNAETAGCAGERAPAAFRLRNPLKLLHHTTAGLTLRASVERYVLSDTLRLQHLDRDAILFSELCDQ